MPLSDSKAYPMLLTSDQIQSKFQSGKSSWERTKGCFRIFPSSTIVDPNYFLDIRPQIRALDALPRKRHICSQFLWCVHFGVISRLLKTKTKNMCPERYRPWWGRVGRDVSLARSTNLMQILQYKQFFISIEPTSKRSQSWKTETPNYKDIHKEHRIQPDYYWTCEGRVDQQQCCVRE